MALENVKMQTREAGRVLGSGKAQFKPFLYPVGLPDFPEGTHALLAQLRGSSKVFLVGIVPPQEALALSQVSAEIPPDQKVSFFPLDIMLLEKDYAQLRQKLTDYLENRLLQFEVVVA